MLVMLGLLDSDYPLAGEYKKFLHYAGNIIIYSEWLSFLQCLESINSYAHEIIIIILQLAGFHENQSLKHQGIRQSVLYSTHNVLDHRLEMHHFT